MTAPIRLYTVNQWNKRKFEGGGSTYQPSVPTWQMQGNISNGMSNFNNLISTSPYQLTQGSSPLTQSLAQSNPFQSNGFSVGSAASGASKGGGLGSFIKGFSNMGAKGAMKGSLIGTAASLVGQGAKSLISDGMSTKAGNAVASIGGTVGGIVSNFNPVIGGIITAGTGVIGGIINRGFGYQLFGDKEAKENINRLNKTQVDDSSFDSISNQLSNTSLSTNNVRGRNGWFNHTGTKKAKALNKKETQALSFANRSFSTATQNAQDNQLAQLNKGYYALGGPVTGPTDYSFMSDYLTMKNDQVQNKGKGISMPGLFGYSAPLSDTLFASGGQMKGALQTHGADWTNGVTQINSGGVHELNPNEGVQYGTDAQGIPNLVEEGEVVWNDFVFSNRIAVPDRVKKKYGIRGKRELSFADAAKKLQKESEERPNAPISQAGLKVSLNALAEEQENLKAKMEAQRAREEFAALSPRQQQAVMQEIAARQLATQQQAQQQEAMQAQVAQQAQQQEVPQGQQEQLQQQMVAANTPDAQAQPYMESYGGAVHTYGDGGEADIESSALKRFAKAMGFHTIQDIQDWIGANNLQDAGILTQDDNGYNINFDNLAKEAYLPAIAKVSPAFAHSLQHGNRFQNYNPSKESYSFDFKNGTWDTPTYDSWKGSNDPVFTEAKGLTDKSTTEDLAEAMKNTAAYKRMTQWLQDYNNSAKYLDAIIQSNDAPEGAKNWAKKFRDNGKWKDGVQHTYQDVYGEVRDTMPGTFWKSVPEALRSITSKNFVIGDDGKITEALDTDGLENLTSYSWGDDNGDITYNYYKAKVPAATGKTATETSTEKTSSHAPKYRNENMRYAGLMGHAIGLGLWSAGVGKPDYSGLDAAVSSSSAPPIMSAHREIGDYLTYNPIDVNYEINKLNAEAGASRRALLNSGSSPSRGAAILASDYNNIGKIGDLYKNAEEYNFNRKKDVAEFNRGTNQYNASAFNNAALQYAKDYNDQRSRHASMQMEAAKQRMDADAGWYNSLYGNIGQFASGLAAIGKENAQHNQIVDLAQQGVFGVIDPDSPMGARLYYPSTSKSSKKATKKYKKGGLTY